MDAPTISEQVVSGLHPEDAARRLEALKLDAADPLRDFRSEFIFPTRKDLHSKTILDRKSRDTSSEEPSLYLCGNSLGLQPKLLQVRVAEHLNNWAQKAVTGHFTRSDDATLDKWIDADDEPARILASMVGAEVEEVAAMETLSANLHILMASFYKPTKERFKIIIEGKAFPSDHYTIETQLRQHGFTAREGVVTIFPEDPARNLTTEQIKAVIDEHASTTALILLPGIQYYTGQLLDIASITAHAHSHGLTIGWDLAHAAGNVPLQLHDWGVDFAAWCHYKYINSGPGAIAGLFVHSKHGNVDAQLLAAGDLDGAYRHRLGGWWGHDKAQRFEMNTVPSHTAATAFIPRQGAAGFQLGNPCILALAALQGSLEVFARTDMATLRAKSLRATAFLEQALDWQVNHFWDNVSEEAEQNDFSGEKNGQASAKGTSRLPPYSIITPRDPAQRGAQLSVLLHVDMLDAVMARLDKYGVVVDERHPDVVRVAPAPLYNSFEDCWRFAYIFAEVCRGALIKGYEERLGL